MCGRDARTTRMVVGESLTGSLDSFVREVGMATGGAFAALAPAG